MKFEDELQQMMSRRGIDEDYFADDKSDIEKEIIALQRGSIDRPDRSFIPSNQKSKPEVFAPRVSRVSGIKGFYGEPRTENVLVNAGLDVKEMGQAYVELFGAAMEDPIGTAKAVALNFGPAMVESYTRWMEAYDQGVLGEAIQEHPLQAAQDLALPIAVVTGGASLGTKLAGAGAKTVSRLSKAAKVANTVNDVLDPGFLAAKGIKKIAGAGISKLSPAVKSAGQAMNIAIDPVVEKVPIGEKASVMAAKVKQGMIDQFYPIRDLGKKFEMLQAEPNKKGKIPPARVFIDSPIEQKVRLYSGLEEKVTESLRNGMPDPENIGQRLTNRTTGMGAGKGLAKIFDETPETLWSPLRDYAVAKRAVDIEAVGKKSGMDMTKAQQIIDLIENADNPQAKQILQTHQEWLRAGDDLLEYYQQGGMISKETADLFRERNPNYVPFFRQLKEAEGTAYKGVAIKELKGSEKPIRDPMESHMLLASQMMRDVEINNVVKELLPMADQPGTGVYLSKNLQKAELDSKMLEEVLIDGKAIENFDLMNLTDEAKSLLDEPLPKKMAQIPFYKDGKQYMISLEDPMVAQAFAGFRASGANKIHDFFQSRSLLNVPRTFAALKRSGITLSPGFTLGLNLFRDTFSASANSRYGFLPVYQNVRGLFDYVKKGELYDLWAASGGMQAELSAIDRPQLRERLHRYLDPSNRGYLNKIKNSVVHPIEFLQAMQRVSEATTRLGEFGKGVRRDLGVQKGETFQDAILRAKGRGEDVNAILRKAAVSSRDISTDFGIKPGNPFMRTWNMMAPFQNAQMQSLDLLRRKLGQGTLKQRGAFAARAGLFMTIPSMISEFMLMDDAEYHDDVPDFEKDLFWHIRMPEESPILPGKLARVPKPFEVGLLFGTLPQRAFRAVAQEDLSIMNTFFTRVKEDFQPFQFPAAFQLPLELWADRDFFFDAPLTPASQKRFRTSEQALPSTSQLARVLSKWTEYMDEALPGQNPPNAWVSPIQIDKMITGTTGTMGRGIAKGLDPIFASREIIQPEEKKSRVPVLNRFQANPSGRSQIRTNFYDVLQSHEQFLNSLADPRMPESDRTKLLEDRKTIANAKMLRRTRKAISQLVKKQKQIQFSRQIKDAKEKRRLMDGIDTRINQLAKKALESLK